jgi:16S rRNA (cytosine1402-N4)-methyltransferase
MISVMSYHIPVLLSESIEALQIDPDGVYVDLTFGGGGHSMAILEHVMGGRLYAFDQDKDAEENAGRISSKSFTFIRANFRQFHRYLKAEGVSRVDGILADLGVSSHQIDEAKRGFSIRFEADLDMRMDQATGKTARHVLNKYSEEDLHRIFGMYGEVKNARTLASAIVRTRAHRPFRKVEDLKSVLYGLTPRGREYKYFAKVFQALRIEVNDELEALKEMLTHSVEVLRPGGRMVVISYHSLEDRLVKNFFAKGKFHGELDKDVYGNVIRPFMPVTRRPVEPSDLEMHENRRARSAKLRIAERTEK